MGRDRIKWYKSSESLIFNMLVKTLNYKCVKQSHILGSIVLMLVGLKNDLIPDHLLNNGISRQLNHKLIKSHFYIHWRTKLLHVLFRSFFLFNIFVISVAKSVTLESFTLLIIKINYILTLYNRFVKKLVKWPVLDNKV